MMILRLIIHKPKGMGRIHDVAQASGGSFPAFSYEIQRLKFPKKVVARWVSPRGCKAFWQV
jgi:hypothetical protein